MFKNSFWIHLKGTRGLHLPRAVTRIQKPAMGRRAAGEGGVRQGGLRSSQERKGCPDPRIPERLRIQSVVCACPSACPFLSCSLCFNYWTLPSTAERGERKNLKTILISVASC